MPDFISKYILASNLQESDITQIINDTSQSITVKRQGTTGDGFSSEIADYTTVGTIVGRIDNIDSGSAKYKYKIGANQDVKANENTFVGVALVSDSGSIGVTVGDLWNDGTYDYRIQEFIGIRQNKVEVVLKLFVEAFPAVT